MNLLAIETSCDETCVAVLRHDRILANVVASQIKTHVDYGGVVPELAAREHLANIGPVLDSALRTSGLVPEDLNAVAATRGPGLPPALLVGWRAAQGFAFARDIPCLGLHHHEAHLYSPWFTEQPWRTDFERFAPSVSLIVSGGHTLLVKVTGLLKHRILGATLDDAAGECFDKIAKLIGLPYPGGQEMERLATEGDPEAYRFPRPMIHDSSDNFSFSGLKTAVRYYLEKHPDVLESEQSRRDICASVQTVIVEVLTAKTLRAAAATRADNVTLSGGVARNNALRRRFQQLCREQGRQFRSAPAELCTDNAAMVAGLASLYLNRGHRPDVDDADIRPGWALSDLTGS